MFERQQDKLYVGVCAVAVDYFTRSYPCGRGIVRSHGRSSLVPDDVVVNMNGSEYESNTRRGTASPFQLTRGFCAARQHVQQEREEMSDDTGSGLCPSVLAENFTVSCGDYKLFDPNYSSLLPSFNLQTRH